MQVIGLREHPEYFQAGLAYIKRHWANEQSAPVFDDCISHSLTTPQPLPRWYVLEDGGRPVSYTHLPIYTGHRCGYNRH